MRGRFLGWSSAKCMINEGQVYWNVGLEIVKTIPQAPENPSPTKTSQVLEASCESSEASEAILPTQLLDFEEFR